MAYKKRTSLTGLLDRRKFKEAKANLLPTSKNPRFRPSDIGIPCLRKIFYSYTRAVPDYPKSLDLQWYGAGGDAYHQLFQEEIKAALRDKNDPNFKFIEYRTKKGKLARHFKTGKVSIEFPINNKKLEVKLGYVDGVVVLDGELWILEIKTAGTNSMKSLRKPKSEHLGQAHFCLNLFNACLKRGKYTHIPALKSFTKAVGVILFYVNRDRPSDRKEFKYLQSPEPMKELITKCKIVKKAALTKTLPPKTDYFCHGCEFREKCERDELS